MKLLKYLALLLVTGSAALLLAGCGKSNIAAIGDTVSIGFTSNFSDGTLFESGSMSITVGSGQFIKGVEDAVVGMKPGETKTVTITPNIGYGSGYDQNKVQKISKLIFDKINVKAESGTETDLGDIHGLIRGTETDSSGNQFVLFDVNPKQTWNTLTYTIELLGLTK